MTSFQYLNHICSFEINTTLGLAPPCYSTHPMLHFQNTAHGGALTIKWLSSLLHSTSILSCATIDSMHYRDLPSYPLSVCVELSWLLVGILHGVPNEPYPQLCHKIKMVVICGELCTESLWGG